VSGPAPALESRGERPLYNALSAAGAQAPAANAASASAAGAPAPACPDPDGDFLCTEEELALGTDPNKRDTDGDALDDGLEVKRYTEGTNTLDLKALGANPRKRDIFLEIDYTSDWKPLQAAVDDVTRAFAAAPVKNHDGSQGIALHVDVSNQITLTKAFSDYPHEQVNEIKDDNIGPGRKIAYHYAIFAPSYGSTASSGISLADGPTVNLLVTLAGSMDDETATLREKEAGTLMHELGHNLGLQHGGMQDNGELSAFPYQPHYLSVMSYTYQFYGVHRNGTSVMDFARAPVRALDERSLNEVAAFSIDADKPDPELLSLSYPIICTSLTGTGENAHCHQLEVIFGSPGKNIDLNRSGGTYQTMPVSADIDGDGQLTTIRGLAEEWTSLDYGGGGVIGQRKSAPPVVPESAIRCGTPEELTVRILNGDRTPAEPPPQLPDPTPPNQEPQLPEEPLPPEEEPQWPEEPAPPEEEPQWPEEPAPPEEPVPPEEEPQWPEEPAPPEEPVPPEEEPQWPEEPAPPEEEPQWPEDPENPEL